MPAMQQQECDLRLHASSVLRPPPKESVADYCRRAVYVPAPQTQSPGWLRFDGGREYCIEPVNDFADFTITDEVLCFGSQSGKTTIFMGGVAWVIRNDPCGLLWVMPSVDLARSFSETRWQPMVLESPELKQVVPTGNGRHDFKKLQQQLGGSILNFIGSNSPSNLASRPARRVILDEVDKFDEGGNGEADAVNLAEQRTKSFANPQRWKSSTPTIVDGLIWQEFLKGDQRRYFVPCPHCSGMVVFAWSKEMTVFPITGKEAFIKWEGGRDYEAVKATAHAVCPHCQGRIEDEEKTKMVRKGKWIPTATAAKGYVSRHLPSLYASSPQTSFGSLAVKFLQAKSSLQGLQGFINGDLAEPWENQDSRSERVEIVIRDGDRKPLGDGVKRILTVDNQQRVPHRWYVARDWTSEGHSRLVEAGHCDEWREIEEIQARLGIANHLVGLDSGDQESKEAIYESDIYGACLAHGEVIRRGNMPVGIHRGWMPMRGMRRSFQFIGTDKQPRPVGLGLASITRTDIKLHVLQFNGETTLDILAFLRQGPSSSHGIRWELTEAANDEYFRHLDGKVKGALKDGKTWHQRSHRWPDHLLDCEKMQVALALFHKLLPWNHNK